MPLELNESICFDLVELNLWDPESRSKEPPPEWPGAVQVHHVVTMLLMIRQHCEAGEAGRAVGDLSEACYYISSHIKYGFLSRDPTAK